MDGTCWAWTTDGSALKLEGHNAAISSIVIIDEVCHSMQFDTCQSLPLTPAIDGNCWLRKWNTTRLAISARSVGSASGQLARSQINELERDTAALTESEFQFVEFEYIF